MAAAAGGEKISLDAADDAALIRAMRRPRPPPLLRRQTIHRVDAAAVGRDELLLALYVQSEHRKNFTGLILKQGNRGIAVAHSVIDARAHGIVEHDHCA